MKVKKLQLTDRQYWPQYICTVFQKTKTISFSRNSVKKWFDFNNFWYADSTCAPRTVLLLWFDSTCEMLRNEVTNAQISRQNEQHKVCCDKLLLADSANLIILVLAFVLVNHKMVAR